MAMASVGVASFLLALGKQNALRILLLVAFVLLSIEPARGRAAAALSRRRAPGIDGRLVCGR